MDESRPAEVASQGEPRIWSISSWALAVGANPSRRGTDPSNAWMYEAFLGPQESNHPASKKLDYRSTPQLPAGRTWNITVLQELASWGGLLRSYGAATMMTNLMRRPFTALSPIRLVRLGSWGGLLPRSYGAATMMTNLMRRPFTALSPIRVSD
ncbi:hypothetical protein J6590_026277 [Homalodisca vitripennis]|nr:hypothetical protein J6590_026277 [Homalodisca vitripennis]